MCDPGTAINAASLAIQVGSSVVGADAQDKASAANEKQAQRALAQTNNDINLRETQEQDAAAMSIQQIERQHRAAQSLAAVSAGEAGVGGASVSAILDDLDISKLSAEETTRQNLKMTQDQLQAGRRGAASEFLNRVNSVPGSNPFLTGLQIGGAGVDYFARQQARKPVPGGTP